MNTRRPLFILTPLLILVLLLSVSPVAYTADPYTIIYLNELRQASQPQILGDQVLFTYQQRKLPHTVAVAFEHQNYTRLHYLERNENDIFLFLLPLDTVDPELDELKYLYVVDGIWVNDLLNPAVGSDFAGKRYSIVSLLRGNRPPTSPLQRDNQTVFFFDPVFSDTIRVSDITGVTYYPDTEQPLSVFVAGSFNGWDPISYPLTRVKSRNQAYYQLSLPLPAGEYRYYFVVNGVPILDPLNDNIAVESSGRQTSFFEVE